MDEAHEAAPESIAELRASFAYGSRSDLNFKFLRSLTDVEFGEFIEELLDGVAKAADDGDAQRLVDTAYRWQVHAYGGHPGDPANFAHRHNDTPLAPLGKPLSECRVALLTSSGHFVEGDDPQPFGVVAMTQAEAEKRIVEFLGSDPGLSAIPVNTPPENLRVRHGGYPIRAAELDHQVNLPIGHLATLVEEGVIGELSDTAYSFVGATSQVKLKNKIAPEWAQRLIAEEVDVVLLVPV